MQNLSKPTFLVHTPPGLQHRVTNVIFTTLCH